MNPDEAWPQRPAAANVERLCIDDVYNREQTRSQKLLIDVDHPALGRITLPGPPLRLDDEGYSGGRDRHAAPPTLGQHTASILGQIPVQPAAGTLI
jgi:formyl-CoA transferase